MRAKIPQAVLPYYLFQTRGTKAALIVIAVVVYFAAFVLGALPGRATV